MSKQIGYQAVITDKQRCPSMLHQSRFYQESAIFLIPDWYLDFVWTRFDSGLVLEKIQIFFLKLKKIRNSKKLKFFLTSYSHSSISFRKSRIYHFDFECTKFKNSNWSIIFNLVSKVSIYFGFFSSSNKKRLMRMRNLIENSMNEECDFCNDIKTFHSISKSSF